MLTNRLQDTSNTLGSEDFSWLVAKLRTKQWNQTSTHGGGIRFGENDVWHTNRRKWQVLVDDTAFFEREGFADADHDEGDDEEKDEDQDRENPNAAKLRALEGILKSGMHPKTKMKMDKTQIQKVKQVIELLKNTLTADGGEAKRGSEEMDGDEEDEHHESEQKRMEQAKEISGKCAGKEPDWCAEEADTCGDPNDKVGKLCPCTCGSTHQHSEL
jgi:hypothetical protein